MTVHTCSVTARGAALARRLPYPHHHGSLMTTVRDVWAGADGLVLIGAAGIAVRAIAPVLGSKATDPAVVAVDDSGRWAIVLAGGHARHGNALAREVAALLGAEPVVTTATDGAGWPGLDDLPGLAAEGDVAGVSRRWLDGEPPVIVPDPGLADWPLPPSLAAAGVSIGPAGVGPRVLVTDRDVPSGPGTVLLRPRSLVLGVGLSTGADPARAKELVDGALRDAGLHRGCVGAVATIDRKADEAAVRDLAVALDVPVRVFSAAELDAVATPNPSAIVREAVGTASVAEAAAVLAAGPGGELVVTKRKTLDATTAVARRRRPEGSVQVVGLGPGDPALRTPAAAAAIRHADTVIGYGPYVDLAGDLLRPGQDVRRFPIGEEQQRCATALERAGAGHTVALVCSGDPGVYAMAGLVLELAAAHGDPAVEVIPGVTAALAAAAVLGAPLGHDHAAISLSDLLTPWEVIAGRLHAAAAGDFVVCLYNPRSRRRTRQFDNAMAILAQHRPPTTPAAIVTDAGRPTQRIVRTSIADIDPTAVDMLSIVIVGSTTTRWIGTHMVTPRGYGP